MKKMTYIVLSLIFLASCTNLSSLITTATPQATFTSTPTFTPTITPTITSTPTETPDPNKPSDATGKDPSTGEYTKTIEENGKTVVYVWKQFQFGDDPRNGITGHWFKSWMADGSINLTGYGETCEDQWGDFALNMTVYAIEGQKDLEKIGYIFHPDRGSEWNKYQDVMDGGLSCHTINLGLGNSIIYDLFMRYINILPSDSAESKYRRLIKYYEGKEPGQEYKDKQSFVEALHKEEVTIKIEGNTWVPQKGYEVYWINEEMAENDSTMAVSISGGTTKDYYLKVIAKDGKLMAFIAPAQGLKNQLAVQSKSGRGRKFKSMILFPLEAAIASTYPIWNASFFPFQDYQGTTGIISGTIDGKSVYIDIPFIDFAPIQ